MTEEQEELKPLNKTDQATLAEYLKTWNGTRAWMSTHPKSSYNAARASAAEWLAKPNIKAAIQAKLDELQMSADEALKLLADIARGDMALMMDVSSRGFNLNMQRARELGLTKLIKRVKQKTTTYIAKKESDEDREVTELEVELYDALGAIRDVLKVHGKFTDRVDVTSNGETVGKDDSDTRQQILRKLDSIATATGAGAVPKPTDG